LSQREIFGGFLIFFSLFKTFLTGHSIPSITCLNKDIAINSVRIFIKSYPALSFSPSWTSFMDYFLNKLARLSAVGANSSSRTSYIYFTVTSRTQPKEKPYAALKILFLIMPPINEALETIIKISKYFIIYCPSYIP